MRRTTYTCDICGYELSLNWGAWDTCPVPARWTDPHDTDLCDSCSEIADKAVHEALRARIVNLQAMLGEV